MVNAMLFAFTMDLLSVDISKKEKDIQGWKFNLYILFAFHRKFIFLRFLSVFQFVIINR